MISPPLFSRVLFSGLTLLILVGVFCAGCAGTVGDTGLNGTNVPSPQTSFPERGAEGAGDMVRLTVHEAETALSIGEIKPKDGRIFLIMDLSIENSGLEPELSFDEQLLTLNDYSRSMGITFKMSTKLENPFKPCKIPVGEVRRGQVIFGIPNYVDLYAISLRDETGKVIVSADIREFFTSGPSPTSIETAAPFPDQSGYDQLPDDMDAMTQEISSELDRLPEIQDGISAQDLEAMEDIVALYRNGGESTRKAFDRMLDEGIADKRAYCTPLQALLWIAYDREFEYGNNPLADYDLEKLLDEAWVSSTTSDNYNSEEWQDFDAVVSRLNSPAIITKYGLDVIAYDDALFALWQQGIYPPAKTVQQVFEQKKGICNEQSRFCLYCLLQNGYAYDNFDESGYAATALWAYQQMKPPIGHVTCLYQDGTEDYFIIDIAQHRGIVGPFSSIEEAADATRSGYVGYCLLDPEGTRTFCSS